MYSVRRKAVRSAAQIQSSASRAPRRYSSAEHGKTGDQVHHFAGSSTEHGHHHAAPANENLGTAFFVVLAAIPIAIGVYSFSRPSKDGTPSVFSKVITQYQDVQDRWAARNGLHTAMVEQAAFDRNLFHSSRGSSTVDLKFPEQFNTGSPYNVPAGHGPRNIDQLVKHYEEKNKETVEKQAQNMREREG